MKTGSVLLSLPLWGRGRGKGCSAFSDVKCPQESSVHQPSGNAPGMRGRVFCTAPQLSRGDVPAAVPTQLAGRETLEDVTGRERVVPTSQDPDASPEARVPRPRESEGCFNKRWEQSRDPLQRGTGTQPVAQEERDGQAAVPRLSGDGVGGAPAPFCQVPGKVTESRCLRRP